MDISQIASIMGKRGGQKSVESRFKNLTPEQISMKMKSVRNKTMKTYTEQQLKYAEIGSEKLFKNPAKKTAIGLAKSGTITEDEAMESLIKMGEAFSKAAEKSE